MLMAASNPAEKIVLYRGDYEKVDEFRFKKTNKWCLVGQGVYLTNSLKVAHTYRDKGSKEIIISIHQCREAENRPDALNQAFESYFEQYIYKHSLSTSHGQKSNPKAHEKLKVQIHNRFDTLVESGQIKANYIFQYHGKRVIEVKYKEKEVGHLSEFEFPRQEFESSMLHIERVIHDEFFWELMWDNKVSFGVDAATKGDYVKVNTRPAMIGGQVLTPLAATKARKNQSSFVFQAKTGNSLFSAVRRIITPYGYRGFEYDGGSHIGGFGRHRAFCVWDDEYINDHQTLRFK